MSARERLEAMLDRAGGFRREGSALVAQCPRCRKTKLHFRLYVPRDHAMAAARNQVSFRFSCFSGSCTGWDGKPEFALAEMLGVQVGAARDELYGRSDVLVARPKFDDPFEDDVEAQPTLDLPTQWPAQFYPIESRQGAAGAVYLEGRGVPVEVAREYGVRYSPVDQSVAFPVEQDGVLYGWQTRLIVPHEWADDQGVRRMTNKCSTSPGLVRSRWMFGDRLRGSEHAFVLEGPLDCMKATLCGGNAASMGKVITSALLHALAAYPWRILYVGLDAGTPYETAKLVAEFDQAIRWPGREVRLVEWPLRPCEPCSGPSCARCGGKGQVQMDSGALLFGEVYDLFRAARRVRSGVTFFI